MPIHLSQDDFAELVDQALADVPEQFEQHLENVLVEVRPRPTREMLASMNLQDPRSLLGLYQGVPLTRKSVEALVDWPERIFIFQDNIEAICHTRQEVIDQVRKTVLHEIGHHFGMDEEDLDELGFG